MQRKVNKPIIYSLSAGLFVIAVAALFLNNKPNEEYHYDDDYQYVSKLFDNGENNSAVAKVEETLLKPYTDENVKLAKNFYDYKGDEASQQEALINYDQTYIQNNGVAYNGKENFDIISTISGTVSSVTEDKLQGKIVMINNEDNIVTIYKGLSEVFVKENDVLNQGAIIGKSGTSNINKDLGSHLLFEMTANGSYVNPENYYGQDIKKITNS